MGKFKKIFYIFIIVILFSIVASGLLSLSIQKEKFEVDCIGTVTRVIDGDTIDVYSELGFMEGTTFRVRLADIDAPESYTSDGPASTKALNKRVNGEEIILDIDDVYVYDTTGTRIVAIVYLQVDDSTVLNVNKWLVKKGYAWIDDYPNEFNPNTWKLRYKIS